MQVFTSIDALEMLRFGFPLRISPRVQHEHATRAGRDAEARLAAAIARGIIVVERGVGRISDLKRKHPALSPVDAEGLAWAIELDAMLLADDQDLLAAAQKEGVTAFDVPAVVVAHQEQGMSAKQVKALAFEIEWTAKRTFRRAHRRRFGLE